jgi:hypothetical protein
MQYGMRMPISDEALDAAEGAAGQSRDTVRLAIEAFLEVEAFTEQRTNVVSDALTIKCRLVGPWGEVS